MLGRMVESVRTQVCLSGCYLGIEYFVLLSSRFSLMKILGTFLFPAWLPMQNSSLINTVFISMGLNHKSRLNPPLLYCMQWKGFWILLADGILV